ncbi:RHS repeat-associated core domain-containing protein [Catellatospora paridis]|uniref:RHS repeat-associated core domain-containing protein n=1 Tax=Catellatospora paridis TaxID=1617086 RepID=UPI0012D389F7|nr:RHS repeat-associated core domain-containing protein [Catellatospora paridis]
MSISSLGGGAVWRVADTLGAAGGVVQVRALLLTGSDLDPAYYTDYVTFTLDPDPDADGAASTDVGPGSVNLLTGDYTLSSTDVDEFGVSVNRVASSRRPGDGWLPQGERLTPAQQQVSADSTVFVAGLGTTTITRDTSRGQGGSADSLALTPTSASADSFAAIGGDIGGLRLGMQPGKRYRATGWVYVPAATGLSPADERGLRIAAYYTTGNNHQYLASPRASFVDGWQQLTVDFAIPAGASEAFVRLYNGFNGTGGAKPVYWDNLSVKELVAPFGPQWRGGVTDAAVESDYTELTFPTPELAHVVTADGGWVTFARNAATGTFTPEPGAEELTLTKVDATHYRVTDTGGTVAEFTQRADATTYGVTATWDTSTSSKTTYVYNTTDNRALVTKVISPAEPGVGDCAAAIPAKGCEVLEYVYADVTTATGTTAGTFGLVKDQVSAVKIWAFDPAAGAVTATEVTRYAYDSRGWLREVWDPRLTNPIKTSYDYGPAAGTDAVDAQNSLAVNGGFNNGISNWTGGTGTNWHVYGPGETGNDPYEGSGFLATNTAVTGGSMYQDVNLAINPGDTFCGTAQVATEGTIAGASGSFVLWLIGESQTNSIKPYANLPGGNNWTPISTCVTATTTYNKLRVQFYPNPNALTTIIDAVDVHRSLAVNGGFNNGFSNWTGGAGTNYAVYGPGVHGNEPYEGSGYAATNTTVTGGSIYQDVNLAINPGDTFCGTAQVATQGTAGGASGSFVLWLMGESQTGSTKSYANLPVGSNWTPIATCITATATYNKLRVQFYPNPNAPTTIIDAVDVRKSIAVNGRVTKVQAGADLPWNFDYGTVGADPNAGRLHRVRRASLVPGTADQVGPENTTRVVYNVPLTRAAGGPQDMDSATIGTWGQLDRPVQATAIFGPQDDPIAVQATPTLPGPNGYTYATVHFLNASGQQVNTATPSAAGVTDGNIDTIQYNRFGKVVSTLEATNRLLALGTLPKANATLSELGLSGLDTKARAAALSTVSTYSADGIDLLSTTGPSLRTVLDAAHNGTSAEATVVGRPHTVYAYDEGKPDGTNYHLVTTEASGLTVDDSGADADVRVTKKQYGSINGSASGWVLRQPTKTITDAGTGGANLTAYVVYDAAGKVLKSWGIGSDGNDAAAKQTIYYTAGANADDAACGNRPEYAGQLCVSRSVGVVTGHDPANMPGTLPVRRVTAYNRWGDAATVTEANAGKTRTTTTMFDLAGRAITVSLNSDDGSTAVPTVTTAYDPATGRATQTTAGAASIVREYDDLGRLMKYTNADGYVTASEFDRFGRPARTLDPTGTVTYGYDRSIEPRGMLTSLTDNNAGTFTAGYSADGQLTTVGYPGGIARQDTLDANLQPVARTYTRTSDSTVIYAEQVTENAHGQWATHTYTGGRSKAFTYDRLGRLTRAAHVDGDGDCTVRTYEFSGTSGDRTNRSASKVWQPGADGECDQSGDADTTTSYAYDSADRLVSDTLGAYVYDAFGRATTLPGGLTNVFHVNDMIASQAVGDVRQGWTLDPAQRLRTSTTETLDGTTWTQSSVTTNHYGGSSDMPRWITDGAGGNWTRNVSGPDGDLAVTVTQAGVRLLLGANLHGDIAFSVNLDTAADVILYDYDEYGNKTERDAGRYAWLGAKQRSAEALSGVITMGARLYDPRLGRFLSVDPIVGGNCNPYDYVCQDPANQFDLDGRCRVWSIGLCLFTVAAMTVWHKAKNSCRSSRACAFAVAASAILATSHRGMAKNRYVRACAVGAGITTTGDTIKNKGPKGMKGKWGWVGAAGCFVAAAGTFAKDRGWILS